MAPHQEATKFILRAGGVPQWDTRVVILGIEFRRAATAPKSPATGLRARSHTRYNISCSVACSPAMHGACALAVWSRVQGSKEMEMTILVSLEPGLAGLHAWHQLGPAARPTNQSSRSSIDLEPVYQSRLYWLLLIFCLINWNVLSKLTQSQYATKFL